MADLPPDWAIERALSLAPTGAELEDVKRHWPGHTAHIAFARYIAVHEQPPIDPLLIEAREIVARGYEPYLMPCAESARAGSQDDQLPVKCALVALRRGIELAKEQGK